MLAKTLGNLLSPPGRRARLAVFCYHQVLDDPDPYRPGEPDVAAFTGDMETVASVFTVLPLPDAARRLAEGTLPARAACITFDDGYRNNQTLAAPVLERMGMPATFFIAGGAVDQGVMWNDLIIEAMIRRGGDVDTADLAGFAFSEPGGRGSLSMLGELLEFLKYKPLAERWEAARQFHARNTGDQLPRLMMDRADVADLAERGFDIGGHTINHPILRELAHDEARAEISLCSQWIQDVTGQRPRTFAYPNGIPGKDFGPEHEAMVADAGFEMAASTEWALARPGSDRFRIPRLGPWWRQGRRLATGLARGYVRSYI